MSAQTPAPMSPERYMHECEEADKRLQKIIERNAAGTHRTWPLPSEILEAKFPSLPPLE